MGAAINAYPKAIHQLTAEPTREQRNAETDKRACVAEVGNVGGILPAKVEAANKEKDNDHVADTMDGADALRPCVLRNGAPVNQPEDRRQQARQDSSSDHVKSHDRPPGI